MKKLLCLLVLIFLVGCTIKEYKRVSPKEAEVMMSKMSESYVIVDVREANEYQEGHIEGAINIPLGEIEVTAPNLLKDKNQTIFVYCRSGNRSQTGSQTFVELGYKNVIEMGGIIDWEGNVIK